MSHKPPYADCPAKTCTTWENCMTNGCLHNPCLKLEAELAAKDALLTKMAEALEYWVPREEPLPYQHDEASTAHKSRWDAARDLLTEYRRQQG